MGASPQLPGSAWLWNDNEFVECESVPLTDRGFRYGMSVFESLPVRGGKPFFLPQHYERLLAACGKARFGARLPKLDDIEKLLRGISFDAFARIYVTAGDGAIATPAADGRVFVFVDARNLDRSIVSYKLAASLSDPYIPLLGGIKTANYWARALALQEAVGNGQDEMLWFNRWDVLISACMANVFVVKGGRIKTPSTTADVRPGVVREWVMGKCIVEEEHIRGADLHTVDEIFLTSSWLGIMPVEMLEGEPLRSQEVARQLRAEYEAEIK